MITRDDALRFFEENKVRFTGINGGVYIDQEDFEKFAESLPSELLPPNADVEQAAIECAKMAAIQGSFLGKETIYHVAKESFIAGAGYGNKDYEEVLKDHKRLVRELDEIINGKEGMAKQASLCDIVAQLKKEYSRPSIDIVEGLKKIFELSKYDPNHDNMLYNVQDIHKLVKELLKQNQSK